MQEQGIVLLFTLIMIVIVSIITMSLLSIVAKENITAVYYQQKLENEYLIQAATATAKQRIKEKLATNEQWRTCGLKGINCFGSLRYNNLLDSKKIKVDYRVKEISDEQGKANVNYLSVSQLRQLPGVGTKLSTKIKQYSSKKHFIAKEEIKNLKGVGARKYQKLVSLITVETTGKINLNTASYQVLKLLKDVGPFTAAKIITYRQTNGPFKLREELKSVKGIGPSTYQNLVDEITVESNLFTIVLEVSIPKRDVKTKVRELIKLSRG